MNWTWICRRPCHAWTPAGFQVRAANARLCLITYGEAVEITLFASGRVIIEHLAPDDPQEALALTRHLLLTCNPERLHFEESIP